MGTHTRVGCHRVNRVDGFFAEHGYLRVPPLVQWMATLRCGLFCEHCLAVSAESGFSDMPVEKVRGLIDEVAEMGVGEFLLTGGEPLVREDLGEVIEYLGDRGVIWSLNTAAMPDRGLREVIARNKPGFVAVSLDGPKDVHDGFRGRAGAYEEATDAIRFFKSLGDVRVCAGTTVTSRNYDCLDETFHLVAASGVDRWGIHLLVPEGRAADRPDLFLSKAQLRRLIKFVARKRRYFRVEMADEIGYLGYLEPLVRDVPLSCGAGRAQCVVLPDGHIVPCTTLDRSCSAGNIHERSLAQIWAEGFTDLRAWKPSGKCSHCDYSAACRGGCWLQRKAGTHCFKEVWHAPGALKTAAGIAICLGSLAASEDSKAANPATAAVPVAQATSICRIAATAPPTLDQTIMNFYVNQTMGAGIVLPSGVDWNDPGWEFFKDFKEGTLPQGIPERCTAARNALETTQQSLSLIALTWRAVSEPLFAAGPTKEYTEAERLAIRDTLAAMKVKADEWRLEIFAESLDPFLVSGRQTPPSPGPATKAGGPSYRYDQRYYLSKDLNEERWGPAANPETREAAEAYLQAHHYADQMDLTFAISPVFSRTRAVADNTSSGAGLAAIMLGSSGSETVGVFDVIATTADVILSFQMKGALRSAPLTYFYDPNEESLLNDEDRDTDLGTVVQVVLSAGREYTYAELLSAVYQQQRNILLEIAYDWLRSDNLALLWRQYHPLIVAVHENGVLLWPAFKEIARSEAILPPNVDAICQRAVLKDIDFWMF